MNPPSEAMLKMQKARAGLVLDQPFFASLALRLQVVEDASCETAWTDGVRLGFNPEFIMSLSLEATKGLFCHEVMHLATSHHARRGDREHRRFNAAGDYAINQILEDAHIPLPSGRLLDAAFKGMTAEAIYSHLPSQGAGKDSQGQGQDGSGKGQSGSGSGQGKKGKEKGKKGQGAGQGGQDDQNGQSGEKVVPTGGDPGRCGEVRDAPGADGQPASPADKAQAEAEWKVAVAQAARAAKSQGKLPAGLDRFVEVVLETVEDIEAVLRQFVEMTARDDYSWSMPSRRHISRGLYLPSLRSEELRPIVVGIDTSASISQEILNRFAGILTGILEEHPTTSCTVIYCDAAVGGVDEFTGDDLPLKLTLRGGGETDFRPVFEEVEKRGLTPSCLIYLTDLDGTFPSQEPDYPVLWVKTEDTEKEAPFGQEVRMRESPFGQEGHLRGDGIVMKA